MDSDLQQYNGTQAFPATADVGTNADVFLEVTDGPIVTADNNTSQKAPINRSVSRLKDYVLGLRGAIVGDFTGAVKKTIQGMRIAIVGGATSTTAPGVLEVEGPAGGVGNAIVAFSGNIHAELGDVVAQTGDVVSVGSRCIAGDTGGTFGFLSKGILGWLGTLTGATGSNPPGTTATPNQLRALNTPKAWVTFTSNGVNDAVVIIKDSHAIASMTKVLSHFTVTFATAFDSVSYAVLTGCNELDQQWVEIKNKTTTTCEVWIYDTSGFKNSTSITGTQSIDLLFMGRQTT